MDHFYISDNVRESLDSLYDCQTFLHMKNHLEDGACSIKEDKNGKFILTDLYGQTFVIRPNSHLYADRYNIYITYEI